MAQEVLRLNRRTVRVSKKIGGVEDSVSLEVIKEVTKCYLVLRRERVINATSKLIEVLLVGSGENC
jgi:hypothetical protein